MEVDVVVPPLPTQAVKSKIPKSKTLKPPQLLLKRQLLQNLPNLNQLGVFRWSSVGEGRGEHQENPKDKVGEISVDQPSLSTVSQKDVDDKMDSSSLLSTSSQQGVGIEIRPQPGTQTQTGQGH